MDIKEIILVISKTTKIIKNSVSKTTIQQKLIIDNRNTADVLYTSYMDKARLDLKVKGTKVSVAMFYPAISDSGLVLTIPLNRQYIQIDNMES
jgi:hypothetical protein